jgi:hypothetical protein
LLSSCYCFCCVGGAGDVEEVAAVVPCRRASALGTCVYRTEKLLEVERNSYLYICKQKPCRFYGSHCPTGLSSETYVFGALPEASSFSN